MEKVKAKVSEIFYSIQGEGIYVGYPQVFIRFWGCNLDNCRFCDTQGQEFKEYSVEELIDELLAFDRRRFHSVSITGGEPLLQVEFLEKFLPLYKGDKRIYLETNGTLPDALKEVVEYVDIIAMDIKLPSATGLKPYWEEHRKFLLSAWDKEVFVKTVITKGTTLDDIKNAVELIISVDPTIPLVLQPATEEIDTELVEKIFSFQEEASISLPHVRIIPQLHKYILIR